MNFFSNLKKHAITKLKEVKEYFLRGCRTLHLRDEEINRYILEARKDDMFGK